MRCFVDAITRAALSKEYLNEIKFRLEAVLEQINAEVIPYDHPSLPKLRGVFGDHTFFVDGGGLIIVEPLEQEPVTGELVKVASWDNADPPHLVAHAPEQTDVLIELESMH